MKETALVSVIVTIYGVEKYLPKCIDSIIGQTYKNLEILLVDDGSPDNCPNICDVYSQKDSRIKVIHKPNSGLVTARKIGVEDAFGEYIAFVDGDDWLDKYFIEKLVFAMLTYDVDLVMCSYFFAGVDNVKRGLFLDAGRYDKKRLEEQVYSKMLYTDPFYEFGVDPAVWNKLYKKEYLMANISSIPSNITVGEDAASTYSLLLDIKSFYVLDEPLYFYRQNMESMTNSYNIDLSRNTLDLILYLRKVAREKKSTELNRQIDFYLFFITLCNLENVTRGDFRDIHHNYMALKWFIKKTNLKKAIKKTRLKGVDCKHKVILFIMTTWFGEIVIWSKYLKSVEKKD